MSENKWVDGFPRREEYYTNRNGKILGVVEEAHRGHWSASGNGASLGTYINRESAKKAVELALPDAPEGNVAAPRPEGERE